MNEMRAWDLGRAHVERLKREAAEITLLRSAEASATGRGGHPLAAAARGLARGLSRLADSIERRQRPHLT